ncbi:hypothetical protein BWL13_00308 [Microbacterium oleivorans]|nr:hypothetical protein BWL13_00308 [Microbacterium oleivorans]
MPLRKPPRDVGGGAYRRIMTDQSSIPENDPADTTDADAPEMLGGQSGDTAVKDPEEWVTGNEPMTGAQRSYLDTLAREAGEEIPATLTKAEASEHIDRLQQATGRGATS